MKILIPTAKEMNTDLPSIEAIPLKPESQAVLDALALYSASQLGEFLQGIQLRKRSEEFSKYPSFEKANCSTLSSLETF